MKKTITNTPNNYPDWYQKDNPLSYDDQKFISENIPLTSEAQEEKGDMDSLNAYESVNGIYKRQENLTEKQQKLEIITTLKSFNYRTHPKIIAEALEALFSCPKTKEGHWLYIAQHWTAKSINSVISEMIKRHSYGEVTIRNAPAYFTKLIKFHHMRKRFRATNGTYKQQGGEKTNEY